MKWTPPVLDGIVMCQSGSAINHGVMGSIMGKISVIGLDLANNVFQVHGANVLGKKVLLSRSSGLKRWSFLRACRAV